MTMHRTAHPSHETLAAFAQGKLADEDRALVESHLHECPDCVNTMSSLSGKTRLPQHTGRSPRDQSTPRLQRQSTTPDVGKPSPETVDYVAEVSWKPGSVSGLPGRGVDPNDIPAPLRQQNKYQVLRLLGKGGMGAVYQAHHVAMDRQVAIKVVHSSLLDHPEAIERFNREIRAAARLDHPNVARAFDADEFSGLRVLVMEFIPGMSLDRILEKQGPLPVAHACHYVMQAARGLAHAHEHGMVHRDLKPQNLMLTPKGVIKVLDFGLASLGTQQSASRGITREHQMMGTPHYMAPEQGLDAKKADIRADIYSLGCTLFCLLTGRPPFERDTDVQLVLAHLNDVPPRLTDLRPDIPPQLADLVDHLLAKDPADRPQDPADVAKALLPFTKDKGLKEPTTKNVAPVKKEDIPVRAHRTPAPAPIQPEPLPSDTPSGKRKTKKLKISGAPGASVTGVGWWILPVVGVGALLILGVGTTAFMMSRPSIEPTAKKPDKIAKQVDPADLNRPVVGGLENVRTAKLAADGGLARKLFPEAEWMVGEWRVEPNGDVHSIPGNDPEPARISFGDPNWTEYELSLFMRAEPRADRKDFEGMAVGFNVTKDLYGRCLVLGSKKVYLYCLQGSSDVAPRRERELESKAGFWHHVRVTVKKNLCSIYLNGEFIFKDDDPNYSSGRVSLGTNETGARFRNIRVASLDGSVIYWEGPPDISEKSRLVGPNEGPEEPGEMLPGTGSLGDLSKAMEALSPDIVGGDWQVSENKIIQASQQKGRSMLVFGSPQLKRYNLKLTVKKADPAGEAKVGFHFANPGNFRMVSLEKDRGLLGISLLKKWQTAEVPLAGPVHEVRLEVRDAAVTCFIDGHAYKDTRKQLVEGRIALGSRDTAVEFQNIELTNEQGGFIWSWPKRPDPPPVPEPQQEEEVVKPKIVAPPKPSRTPRSLERALLKPVRLNYSSEPLRNVVSYIALAIKAPIVMDEQALARKKISPEVPVTIEISDIPAGEALDIVLVKLGLAARIQGKRIVITDR